MTTIGIIGLGSFGRFLAEQLEPHARVLVYSASGKDSPWKATLEQVAAADYILPTVPLEAYRQTLELLKPHMSPHTTIVDVCSVKEEPVQIIQDILPEQPIVATHPMFGPQSASESLVGHTVVMCPEVSSPTAYKTIKNFLASVDLGIVEMSCVEHDQEIATVQGLTFFVARILDDMQIHRMKLFTPSFHRLLSLAELERQHSPELFETIQKGNPYTRGVRREFLDAAQRLDRDVS